MERKKTGTGAERKAAEQGMRRARERGGAFVEAVEATRMPMVVTDPTIADNPIVYANPAFLELCGYGMEEVLGHNYHFLIGPNTDPEARRRIDRAVSAREDVAEEVLLYTKDGREIWVSMFVSPVVEDGRIVRHFASTIDITERVRAQRRAEVLAATLELQVRRRTARLETVNRRLEEEVERRRRLEDVLRDALEQGQEHLRQREFLIKEVQHRTKNAIAMASALLRIQAGHTGNAEARRALDAAIERLSRISEVYAVLYRGSVPDRIEVADYLGRVGRGLVSSLQADPERVELKVEVEEVSWGPDLVIPLGLIVNEAITNAMKYAFPDDRKGCIRLELHAAGGGRMRLRVEDDGVGLAKEHRGAGLGTELIELLTEQIGGTKRIDSAPGEGVAITISFRDPNGDP